MRDGLDHCVNKHVRTVPSDTTVSTRVVVTVSTALLVTNRMVTATGDVNQDIQPKDAAKCVNLDILEWIAENVVVEIA